MRRIIFLAAITITLTTLIGCTDESREIEQNSEFEKGLKLIDKDDVESPTTKG